MDDGVLECRYKYLLVRDTLNRNRVSKDLMVLRIGKNSSVFYSIHKFFGDSMICNPASKKILGRMILQAVQKGDYKNIPGGARNSMDYIYKNYPKGKITTRTGMFADDFEYKETYISQDWKIMDSTKLIIGYPCQLAKTEFRGRIYHAWFTPDIPICEGPWKFTGLPGLIMEVYDRNKDYWFLISGIKRSNVQSVKLYDFASNGYIKTSRKAFLRRKRKLYLREGADKYIKATTGIDLSNNNSNFTNKNNAYEFMERDYN